MEHFCGRQPCSGADPLATEVLDQLVLLLCNQEAGSSAQAARSLNLYTITASYLVPADAKKWLVGHLLRWLVATSIVFPELFPEP